MVTIINDNISVLMNEFLKYGVEMLWDMAMRLQKTHQFIDWQDTGKGHRPR